MPAMKRNDKPPPRRGGPEPERICYPDETWESLTRKVLRKKPAKKAPKPKKASG